MVVLRGYVRENGRPKRSRIMIELSGLALTNKVKALHAKSVASIIIVLPRLSKSLENPRVRAIHNPLDAKSQSLHLCPHHPNNPISGGYQLVRRQIQQCSDSSCTPQLSHHNVVGREIAALLLISHLGTSSLCLRRLHSSQILRQHKRCVYTFRSQYLRRRYRRRY